MEASGASEDRVQKSARGGRSVYLRVGLWYSEREHAIHITAPGADGQFHSWVTNNPGSVRHHATLYKHLKRVLQEQGAWPEPDPDAVPPTTEAPS